MLHKNSTFERFNTTRMLMFASVFAVIGVVIILITHAATVTQAFTGKLTTRQTSQSFAITAESAPLNATLTSSSTAKITLSLIDKSGATVATQTSNSPVNLSATTQVGSYSLKVSSPEPISSKGLPFNLNVTYGQADSTPPTTPSSLTATALSGSEISLKWNASTDNVAVVGYDIYRDSVKVGSSPTNTYKDIGLQPLVTYKYYVIAKDASGNSSNASSSVRVKTLNTPTGDTTPPTAPTNLTAVFNDTSKSVLLDWTPSTDNSGIAPHYDIYSNGTVRYSNVTQPPYSDLTVTAGTTYSYYVIARDNVGNPSGPSNTVTVTIPIPDTEKPTTPANLTATVVNSRQINLSWTASTDNVGVTNYYVYANNQIASILSGTTYSHANLTPNTVYSYYVVAKDAAGNASDQSTPITVSTPVADTEKPSAPGNLTVTAISAQEARLTWTASTDNVGVKGYKIYRGSTVLKTLDPSATSYSDTTVQPNKRYDYSVEAFDADGNTNKAYAQSIYMPSAITINIQTPASGSTQSGIITVSGTASSTNGNVDKVEIAGSYGQYAPAQGSANWTASLDTTKIPDSTPDPHHTFPYNRYIFIKASNTATGDFKITTLTINVKNDTTPPTVAITSPANGSTQTGFYTITGTASDNAGLKYIELTSSSSTGGVIRATGTTNWSATVSAKIKDSLNAIDTVTAYDINGNSTRIRFSVNPAPVTYSGTISGRVYQDLNNNGLFDSGDQVVPNQRLDLFTANTQYMQWLTTDSEGLYSFSGLQDGDYRINYGSPISTLNNWLPTNKNTKIDDITVKNTFTLAGSATVDFGWRKINRTPDPDRPGSFLALASLTGPNGLQAVQHDDAVSAQEIYDQTSAGKLIGAETSKVSVHNGSSFGGGLSGLTAAGYDIDSTTGKCQDGGGASYVFWPYWLDSDKRVLFHEYGHSWQAYWSCEHQDVDLSEYMVYRGLDMSDPRVNTDHQWQIPEIVAEDYRQLFSAYPLTDDNQENPYIPRPAEIPGFQNYLMTTYRTPR